ncbi:hypothetical protein CI111_08080 [Fusobacterium animalis]|uniref:Uncharacterized protein n=1 Tax=Fusobacterium animalis TaxID=76859 RepID=A0A2G9F8I7_9FUSO|nr:hypothetical protein [Fusobacterium animalis]PIM89450.1 hypothetical protein CI114_08735 [Fusobacterium animalis]PIM91310.1 hypothetical protein CI111_08080 [Fusobacterium animalis]
MEIEIKEKIDTLEIKKVKLVKILNHNIFTDLILFIGLVVIFVIILRYIFPIINQCKNYILYFFKKLIYLDFLLTF